MPISKIDEEIHLFEIKQQKSETTTTTTTTTAASSVGEILKQKNLKSFNLFEKFVKSKKFSPEKERLFSVYRESLEKCQKIVSYFTKFVLENSNDNLDKI